MSGLVKPKKINWKDTNLALFGSDTEKNVSLFQIISQWLWSAVIFNFMVFDWWTFSVAGVLH